MIPKQKKPLAGLVFLFSRVFLSELMQLLVPFLFLVQIIKHKKWYWHVSHIMHQALHIRKCTLLFSRTRRLFFIFEGAPQAGFQQ